MITPSHISACILKSRRIRKACPPDRPRPVVAVKFINKEHALRPGRLTAKQLRMEITLHQHLGRHRHIIQLLSHGETPAWHWIAMELADGGDLFDRIEADEGVGEDIAHFYFSQLIAAVGYMHAKGVAHRDIKPENVLLSGAGDLKLADFGLAALFLRDGKARLCNTVCGSPPYIAPEIVGGKRARGRADLLDAGYAPNFSDVWSCGVVLFVLLAGNTPWDEPTDQSYEFIEFVRCGGRAPPEDELWMRIPADALSLLRGMLTVDPIQRFSLDAVRTHPWFSRANPYLGPQGTATDGVGLATRMLEALRVDLGADPMAMGSQSQRLRQQQWTAGVADAMDIDAGGPRQLLDLPPPEPLAMTQPETPVADGPFDWELPPRPHEHHASTLISASQPIGPTNISANTAAFLRATSPHRSRASRPADPATQDLLAALSLTDPSLSQFSASQQVPATLTQAARRFDDVLPGTASMTRFFSAAEAEEVLGAVEGAVNRLGVPCMGFIGGEGAGCWCLRVKTVDGRRQGLNGEVVVRACGDAGGAVWEVDFRRVKGDNLEWRRFFKKVVVLCRGVVCVPE